MNECKRIFIVGHPGAGKTVLAKALAEKLNWQFVDADFGLEFRIGCTLTECIGVQGEKAFHDCQLQILKSLLNKKNIVVTTDASIVCHENNRKILSSELVVNLMVSIEVQLERLTRSSSESLLSGIDYKKFLNQLHEERDAWYASVAKISVNSDDHALEGHVLKIIKSIDVSLIELNRDAFMRDDKEFIFFHKQSHQPVRLSHQQAFCLKLMAQGKTSKEIAKEIQISYRTVEGHIAKVMEQLGCSSSKELISLYFDEMNR